MAKMNYYDDSEDADTATMAPEEEMKAEEGSPEDSESAQEVVNRSFFQGKSPKPGDTCQVKVEKVDGDSVLISYVKDMGGDEEGAGDETSGPEEEGEMAGAKSKGSYYE